MLLATKFRPLFITERELWCFHLRVAILIVTTRTGFEFSVPATSNQRRPLTAANAERRHYVVHGVWPVLQLVITGPWHSFFHILVYFVSFRMHMDFWSLSDVRVRLVCASSW